MQLDMNLIEQLGTLSLSSSSSQRLVSEIEKKSGAELFSIMVFYFPHKATGFLSDGVTNWSQICKYEHVTCSSKVETLKFKLMLTTILSGTSGSPVMRICSG